MYKRQVVYVVYITSSIKTEILVCTWVWLFIVFSIALLIINSCLAHTRYARLFLLFTPGYCIFYITDIPTLYGFWADAHRFTLVDGWFTNQSTHHLTHPTNHTPTSSHPSTHTHLGTPMHGSLCRRASLKKGAIPRHLLEHI